MTKHSSNTHKNKTKYKVKSRLWAEKLDQLHFSDYFTRFRAVQKF